ncbi:hypothetical protein HGM15179_002093 [Zosterops borbonicus]|uniref:Uncharacterized protein n=1 Tax=Zosterops borbonicus TaxID=364589 RepID=A0A8K1GV96_9PASS|nr:hypothetical protein HGM15179_002093 [Zosterops borbonicus]
MIQRRPGLAKKCYNLMTPLVTLTISQVLLSEKNYAKHKFLKIYIVYKKQCENQAAKVQTLESKKMQGNTSEYQEIILETWKQLQMDQMGREESGVEGKENIEEGYGG